MRMGASSVEAASGMSPSLINGVDKTVTEPATTWSQCSSMVVPTPTAAPLTAATSGFCRRASAGGKSVGRRMEPASRGLEKIGDVVTRTESPRGTCDHDATDGIVMIALAQRAGDIAVHRKRQRVFLFRAIHADGADTAVIRNRDSIAHDAPPLFDTADEYRVAERRYLARPRRRIPDLAFPLPS